MVVGGDVYVEYMKHILMLRAVFLKAKNMNFKQRLSEHQRWIWSHPDKIRLCLGLAGFSLRCLLWSGNDYSGLYHTYEGSEQCKVFPVAIFL